MVTLYGSDTLNMLRTASETLSLGSDSSAKPLKAKKWIRSQYIELLKNNENKPDSDLQNEILSWFKDLTTSIRLMVVSHQTPLICTFIWQMFIKKLSEGEVDFSLYNIPVKLFDVDNLERNFRISKKSEEAQSIANFEFQSEKSFEQSIRLTDTEEYLDTLTLDTDLCGEPDKLLGYIKAISHGKAFTTPCHAVWDNNAKTWISEYPAWFKPSSFLSLAAWACASIEKSIWANFWELTKVDPRPVWQRKSSRNYNVKERINIIQSWQQQENLSIYLKSLDQKIKEKIVGNIDEITQDYLTIKNYLMNYNTKFINFNTLPNFIPALYPLSRSFLPCYPNPVSCFYFYASKTKIKYYQSHKSAELIIQQLSSLSDYKFIEFLLCSPLERSVTLLDIVVRKALYRIINAYTEKNALDLILDEPVKNEEKKKTDKKKKIKKKVKKQKTEDKDLIKKNITEIIHKIIEEATKPKICKIEEIPEEKNEFQMVFSQKSKHRKQPQQKTKNTGKKNSKH